MVHNQFTNVRGDQKLCIVNVGDVTQSVYPVIILVTARTLAPTMFPQWWAKTQWLNKQAFKRNVNIPSPNEVRRSGTVDCSIYAISQIEGQQFIHPLRCLSILKNNSSTQTDHITENRGVKLRSRQPRLESAKPVLPYREKCQRTIKTEIITKDWIRTATTRSFSARETSRARI